MADDWRAFNEEARQHRAENRDRRTETLAELTADIGVECKQITEYQFRLSLKTEQGINRIDYYPTRNKIHILATGKRFTVAEKDLKNVIIKYLTPNKGNKVKNNGK